MIITKEGEEFQKLLKKVEYLENVIRCSKYYAGCDPYKEEPPKFKVGDWVVRKTCPQEGPERITSIDKYVFMTDRNRYGYLLQNANDEYTIRHATPQEIEEHLIKEAQKRGLVGWRKFRWKDEPDVSTIIAGHGYNYLPSVDALMVMVGGQNDKRAIYMDGKWAEPVFDTTELPKTVSELEKVLKDFGEEIYGSDLLCMIGEDVDRFLKKYNYK